MNKSTGGKIAVVAVLGLAVYFLFFRTKSTSASTITDYGALPAGSVAKKSTAKSSSGGLATPPVSAVLAPQDVTLTSGYGAAYQEYLAEGGTMDYLQFSGTPWQNLPPKVGQMVRNAQVASQVAEWTNADAPAFAQTTTPEQALKKIAEGQIGSGYMPQSFEPTYSAAQIVLKEAAAANPDNPFYQNMLAGLVFNPFQGTWS